MKREYLEYMSNVVTNNEIIIENKFKYNAIYKNLTKADIERQNIIRWVYKVWTNDKLITKESIVNSFKKSGISLNSDQTEEHLFEIPDEIRNI